MINYDIKQVRLRPIEAMLFEIIRKIYENGNVELHPRNLKRFYDSYFRVG